MTPAEYFEWLPIEIRVAWLLAAERARLTLPAWFDSMFGVIVKPPERVLKEGRLWCAHDAWLVGETNGVAVRTCHRCGRLERT